MLWREFGNNGYKNNLENDTSYPVKNRQDLSVYARRILTAL